jgi:hypothetical protein
MEKKAKIILGVVGGLAIVGTGIYLYQTYKPTDTEDTVVDDVINAVSNSAAAFVPICSQNATFPLKKGSKGKDVKEFQNFLNKFGVGSAIVADCDFGTKTSNKAASTFRELGISGQSITKTFYDAVVVPSNRSGALKGITNRPQSWA